MAKVMLAGTPNACRMRWLLCIRLGSMDMLWLSACWNEGVPAHGWAFARAMRSRMLAFQRWGICIMSCPPLMSLACAGLTMLAGVIVMLIAAILFRRILIISGADVTSLM